MKLIRYIIYSLIIPFLLFAQKPYVKNYNKGMEFFQKGDYDKAIQWFEKSIKAKNDWDTVYVSLGQCYLEKNDITTAINNFNKAISLNKNNSSAYFSLAKSYQFLNNDKEALKNYELAYQSDTTNLVALNNIGMLSYKLKDYKKAETAYLKLARINKKDAAVFYNLGNVYFMQEDYDNAIASYNLAIKRNKRNADYYYALGLAHLKNADYPNAKRNFQIAIRLNPQKYARLFDITDYSGIKFEFIRFNFFGDELIAKVSDGIRLGFNLKATNISKSNLEDITGIYLWTNGIKSYSYGLDLSIFYNPFAIDVKYNITKYKLSKIKTNLALPPYNPNSELPNEIDYSSFQAIFSYAPWVLWGKIYNEFGAGYTITKTEYGSKKLNNNSLTFNTSLNFKFSKFWIGTSYNIYTNKNIPSNFEVNIGAWLW